MFRLNNKKIIRCLALAIFFFIMAFMIYFNTIESNLQLAYALDEGTESIEQGKNENSDNTYSPTNEIKFFTEVMKKTVNKSAET